MSTEIQEYSKTEAALAELSGKYKSVIFDCTTSEGMLTATKGRAEIRGYRVALEKMRKEIKEPALRRTQLIDSEARRITAELESLENPIDQQIKNEQARKEFERTCAEREAREKIEAEELARKQIEDAKRAAELAEIERGRADLAKAEAARLEADRQARLEIEKEQRAARMKIEEEERASRIAREEADRVARQDREAEEARIASERKKAEAERTAAEEAQRKLRQAEEDKMRADREAEETKQREIRRKANELTDAREMLLTFKKMFGHIDDFAAVVKAIDVVLKKAAP